MFGSFPNGRFISAIIFVALPCVVRAQVSLADSVFALPMLEVRAGRLLSADDTDKLVRIDSLARLGYLQGHLGDLLAGTTPVAIKQYGPAGIGTSSIRGGSAAQTSVLWNGFPITNPMLAQTDLSLLPAPLIEEVTLTYGSGSALWGSGAVGGVIALENSARFETGWSTQAGIGFGSFGVQQQHVLASHSGKQSVTKLRFFHRQADNDFEYRDLFGETQTLQNARTQQYGAMLGQFFRHGDHQLAMHAWWQTADRQVPPTRVQSISAADQGDRALRLALDYKYLSNRWQLNLRTARFQDNLTFTDSLLNLDTDNRARHYWAEALAGWRPADGHHIESGLQYNHQLGASDAYRQTGRRQMITWLGRYRWTFDEQWGVSLRLRQGWADGQRLPFIPYLGLRGAILPQLEIRANINRSYRLPGLDDLYWNPGGNTNLLPESGWGQEVGLIWSPDWKKWGITYQITGFSRRTDNWIQWTPGPAYWSPQNIRDVWSRGVEQEATYSWSQGPWRGQVQLFYHYVRSTNESGSDPTRGRQLIYVPVHQGGGQFYIARSRIYAQYVHRWNSRSYTTGDHTDFIEGFQQGGLQLGYRWQTGNLNGRLQGGVRNLWDEEYELVANRPLPGRHYELNLIIEWVKP